MLDSDAISAFIRKTARAVVLPRFRTLRAGEIWEKRPGDVVTIADVEMERRLAAFLTAETPGSVVLGEEGSEQGGGRLDLLAADAPVWVIDPVDGTSNFAAGRPGFAVILAYVEGGAARAGWIYDPLGDVMVTAEAGGGAWSAGQRLRVAQVPPKQMIGAAYGRTRSGGRAAAALEESGRIGGIRNHRCSALEYMEIALGNTHFSLHSRSLPWDHAAGMLIVIEAGGVAAFLDGSSYDPQIADRPLLAAASPEGWRTIQQVVTTAD